MREAWKLAKDWYQMFCGTGCYHILYLEALLILSVNRNYPERWRKLFLWFSIIAGVLYFCPLTADVMIRMMGSGVYWRFFWILPVPVLLAYTAAVLTDQEKYSRNIRWMLLIGFVVILLSGGKNLYLNGGFVKAQNSQKLMAETIQIADCLERQRKEGETIRVSVPDEIGCEIRQYDAEIFLPYGRRISEYPEKQELWEAMNRDPLNEKELCRLLEKYDCGYVVQNARDGQKERMRENGWELLDSIGNYQVYREQ